MDLLIKKLKSSLMYFGIALALAVILPIVLKNAFACSVGIAAMLLFGYQSIMYYKAIKNNDCICIKAECVKHLLMTLVLLLMHANVFLNRLTGRLSAEK